MLKSIQKLALLTTLLFPALIQAWSFSPHFVAAQIAYLDLETSRKPPPPPACPLNPPSSCADPDVLMDAENLLSALSNFTRERYYVFVESAGWMLDTQNRGFHLMDDWLYVNYPLYADDYEGSRDVDLLMDWNTRAQTTDSLITLGAVEKNSRINKTLGRSYCLRTLMTMITEMHSPMHNINRYSADLPDGDQNGRLYPIYFSKRKSVKNLYDLWEIGVTFMTDYKVPLSSSRFGRVNKKAKEIMATHTRDSLAEDLAETSKKAWTEDSYKIARDFAYSGMVD